MAIRRFCLLLLALFLVPLTSLFAQESSPVDTAPSAYDIESVKAAVYVIEVKGAIGAPTLFVLRRGLKDAIAYGADVVVLDMDTPGGRVDIMLEMVDMLDRYQGTVITYVNRDAISAGSLIAATTDEIYYAPKAKIGDAGIIMMGGQELEETIRAKMESYINATMRVHNEDEESHRTEVVRAMMELNYSFEIDGEEIGSKGSLLTLTANEAMRMYGDPARPLFGNGIYESIEELFDARNGKGQYELTVFELNYSETIAKWIKMGAPLLIGLGMVLLFLEFKTPGFGIFGIAGIFFIGVFFTGFYIAGLAGNELILFFILGVILVLIELFFFPGSIVFALAGLALMLGSLLWAMVDVWPGNPVKLTPELLVEPLVNLIFGLGIAVFGALLVGRFFKGSFLERRMVLADVAGGQGGVLREARKASLPKEGAVGEAITDLFPSGRVEIKGVRYDARSSLGSIDCGARVVVVKSSDFALIVKEASE